MSIYAELLNHPISSINIEPVTKVISTTCVSKALELMIKNKTSHLLVFEDENLIGIFTERDYLKRVFQQEDNYDELITKYITNSPITMSIDEPVSQILKLMYTGQFRHVPVYTSQNQFTGVLTTQNLFSFLAELLPDKLLNLPPKPHQTLLVEEGA